MSLNGHSADAAPGIAVLHGTLAASVTPLLQGGAAIDEDAFGPLVERYVTAGLDGVLAFGTNGEGVLFSVAERRRGLRLFVEAAAGRLDVAAHCGAQTTADTVALAGDAAEAGAAAVAVIGPPYFPLDEEAQLAHFAAAAAACAPLPFYVYEFARTSGYPIALDVLRRLQDDAANFVGLKVSDAPWDAFAPYLTLGLDVFVGPEALIHRGIEGGAIGAVSALASAFPEQVAAVVREPTAAGAESLAELRAGVERFPRQAAMKRILAAQGAAGQIRRPRAPARSFGGRVAGARRADRLAVGEALAVAAGARTRVDVVDTRQAAEQRGEIVELGGGEVGTDHLLAHRGVRAGGARECLATLLGDHGVGDPGVGRAAAPVGQPLTLEAVEETRDAGGREPQALGEIDPAQLSALRVGEVEKRLEVVRAQAVVGEQARLDRPHQRAMGMQEPDEDGLCRNLWGQYLTRQ